VRAAPLLWSGFTGLDADAVDPGFQPGGVVLFARNLDPDPDLGPARCHALIQGLRARWAPLAVAIDQEGGSVSRLRAWTGPTPGLRQIWAAGGAAACRRWGALWGRGLRLLGCNVDFAPVADLWDPDPGAAMAGRCASPDPLEAAAAAGAFLDGLERQGLRGCLKHFPGLGGLTLDSHLGLPETADPGRIVEHLKPFRILAHPDRLVMVAHLKLPGSGDLPASLCPAWVAGNPWGLRARWLPDDLEMGGASRWPWPEKVRLCLSAGHDALLVCQSDPAARACAEAAAGLPEALAAPAAARFLALRQSLPGDPGPFQPAAWSAWIREVRAEA